MAIFSRPSLRTVANILTDIYGQNVADEEFRFYEVYNTVLIQVLQALEGKGERSPNIRDELAIAPQYALEREALIHPIDPHGYRKDLNDRLALKGQVNTTSNITRSDADELEKAENYLAETSMEAHHSDEEIKSTISDIQNANKDLRKRNRYISTESRIPDFMASHITSVGRRTLLLVEIKPDAPLKQDYVVQLHDQAKLQAAFAFEIFTGDTIHSLMLIGRKFHMKIFERASCKLRHHLLKQVDEEPYSPPKKKRGKRGQIKLPVPEVNPNMWQNVFEETVTKSGSRTTNVEIRGFTTKFKEAMDLVMKSTGVGRIRWGDC
ncbi:hypothetical protein J132_04183 [Termitomyces sp. J132]|nr:hypothetical protein C0989_006759 [Termitomyces sp. Mn162]KAH0591404.1 hypothetical protein H2248_001482 [Termitomyces sp. 'cryptogamus']KNZ82223.1 hypothetical protein J132_04183 [Termitomyces sp. J132]